VANKLAIQHFPSELLLDQIASALLAAGYVVIEQPLPAIMVQGLIAQLQQEQSELTPAGVGRDSDFHRNQKIRGDAIKWLEPSVPAVTEFLCWMDKLRLGINQRLFLGLFDFESHFAVYAPGAFYLQHLDAFKGSPSRKLSTVLYLNPEWRSVDGGELVLYDEAGISELIRVAPECGRLVIFLSEDFPHEVLPAHRPRHSIAGWFRINPKM
jgi:SM-20-related protein